MTGPYLGHTCSVPKPYFLRVEVLLTGECMEQVCFGYVSEVPFLHEQAEKEGMMSEERN